MKKRKLLLVFALTLCMFGFNTEAKAAEKNHTLSSYVELFLKEVKGDKKEDSAMDLEETLQELVKDIKPEDAEEILTFVKEKIAEGKWETKEGIEEAIREGEEKFKTSLTEEQKQCIISAAEKIKKLGIDPEYLVEQAEKIFEKYKNGLQSEIDKTGQKIVEETQTKIKEEISNSLADYFSDMVNNVKSFFKGIFKKQT